MRAPMMAASFTALNSEQPAKMTAFVRAFIVGNIKLHVY